MTALPRQVFITGTDTNIGKTVVSSILMAGTGADYWKPIQSGTVDGTDSKFIQSVLGCGAERVHPERFVLSQPLSPHAAARIDGLEIQLNDFSLPESGDRPLIVEGAGGVLVPLNSRELVIDLISFLRLPTIVVSRSALGTINHTLLTLRALRSHGVEVLGVIMNGERNPGNREAIEHYGQIDVLAEIGPLSSLSPETLRMAFSESMRETVLHM